jgi:hypothetical protein
VPILDENGVLGQREPAKPGNYREGQFPSRGDEIYHGWHNPSKMREETGTGSYPDRFS